MTNILFYIFAGFTVIASLMVVSSRNPVYGVLWLIFAFFNAAGLFILLGAELVAMLLVIVYVGAVAVLFLFVVMMLNIKIASSKKGFQNYFLVGFLLATILFGEIGLVIYNSTIKLEKEKAQIEEAEVEKNLADEDAKKAAEEKISLEDNILNAEVSEAIDKKPEKKSDKHTKNLNTNSHQIGEVLYTDYILPFQVSGLILLVAMIGAIVLTLRERKDAKKQNVSKQQDRTRDNSLTIVKVETGKGI